MIYNDGVELDEDMRMLKCPRCDNGEFSEGAKYCKTCSLQTYNYCEGEVIEDPQGQYEDRVEYHKNPGNARYCETCGQPTVFFKENMLKPWNEVHAELSEEVIADDELPF